MRTFDRLGYYADMQNPDSMMAKLTKQYEGYSIHEFFMKTSIRKEDGQDR